MHKKTGQTSDFIAPLSEKLLAQGEWEIAKNTEAKSAEKPKENKVEKTKENKEENLDGKRDEKA